MNKIDFSGRGKKIFLLQITSIIIFFSSLLSQMVQENLLKAFSLIVLLFNAFMIYRDGKKSVIYFFGGLSLLGLALAFIPTEISLTIVYFVVLIAFFVVFKLFFMKDEVKGKILVANKHWAVIETSFDFASGVRKGVYAIESKKGIKEGNEVIADVRKKFWERRKPWRIKKKT